MSKKFSVAVIGAGLGGLCAGIKLKQAGYNDIIILEKGEKVGGTWRDNTYPGCCCDVPVALYQFSFAPSLDWNYIYPRANEIQAYTEKLADDFGLRPHLHLNEETQSAVWDEARSLWVITTSKDQTYEANILIPALGQLNRPQIPNFEGRENFHGTAFHSARWDHSIDLKNKNIAVIGSAASAVQIIPELAKVAKKLTVFQRTPNWVIPRLDKAITDEEKALIVTAPHVAMLNRELIYENADHLFWQVFSWTQEGRAAFTRTAMDHLTQQVSDAELKSKLIPDYPIGCRRVLIADDYYPALTRSNVELVTDKIAKLTEKGIETKDGEHHDADVIVYATGFETTEWHWSMKVQGKDGKILSEEWQETPQAYLGINVANFPNMFILYGPNTNLGHNSITFMLERQVEYALLALEEMREKNIAAIEVKQNTQEQYNRELQDDLAKTTWADPHCNSWYKNDQGHNTQNWSSNTRDYAKITQQINLDDYLLRP